MLITVQHWDDKTVYSVQAEPTWYVDDLREKIEEQEGLGSQALQRIVFQDNDLDDTETLEEQGIDTDCSVKLGKLSITVVLPTKKVFRVNLVPDDPSPIRKIKKAAAKKSGLAMESLVVRSEGEELSDGQKMVDCQLNHEDTVVVETFTVKVSTFDGELFEFGDINPKQTIEQVKNLVRSKTNIGLPQQKYTWGSDQRPINECLSFRDQSIPSNTVLELLEPVAQKSKRKEKVVFSVGMAAVPKAFTAQKINLTVVMQWNEKTFALEDFGTSMYLDDLREKLQEVHSIPLSLQQVISYDGKVIDEMETLADQGIGDSEKKDDDDELTTAVTLKLEPIKVSIQTEGAKPFRMVVAPGDTVKRIKRIVAKKCGIDLARQLLYLDGKELKENGQDLVDAGLENAGVLHVHTFSVTVEHWNGEAYEVGVSPTDSVDELKAALEEKGIEKSQLGGKIMIHGGTVPLNGFISLKDQQVVHRSRLQLSEPEKKVVKREKFKLDLFLGTSTKDPAVKSSEIRLTIRHWNNDTFDVTLSPDSYVQDLMEKIEASQGIPVDEQRLSLNGTLLDGVDTFEQAGVIYQSELVLQPMKVQIELVLPSNGKKAKAFRPKVQPYDTIKRIKRVTAKKHKLEDANKLFIVFGGKSFDDKMTLKDCGIGHGDTLQVEPFQLNVAHWSGDTFVLDDLSPDDTIQDVRMVIMKRKKIPLSDQNFTCKGSTSSLSKLNDFLSLKAQGISHRSVLIMEDPMMKLGLFSPKSPKPTLSHLKEIEAFDIENDDDDNDDDDDGNDDDDASVASVASWLKEKALSESFTVDLCKVEASEESWLGIQAAKENQRNRKNEGGRGGGGGGVRTDPATSMKIPQL